MRELSGVLMLELKDEKGATAADSFQFIESYKHGHVL